MFAYSICGTDSGTFLDIGACYPTKSNNTYGLECKGWSGITIDSCADYAKQYVGVRKEPLTVLDMTAINWDEFIADHPMLRNTVDYLSFDIDEASLQVLRKLPFDRLQFRVLTVEHDAYRRGDAVRGEMRKILKCAGYDPIATDVRVFIMWNGRPEAAAFEDWYVRPELVDMRVANRFRCDNKLWSDVLTAGLSDAENLWVPV
jgi:Methyltransferase FkbM domain